MPTTFANQINGDDIYAKRAECDAAGNTLSTTYATKAELPGSSQLVPSATSADADKVLTVNAQGTPAWASAQAPISAGTGIDITNNVVSAKVDGTTIDTNASGELTVIGGGGGTTYTAGDGIDITSDVISADVDGTTIGIDSSTKKIKLLSTIPSVDQTYSAASANAQSGTAVAGALAGKEDAFDVGTGLEMDTSGATPTLQVEAPVDIVAGPGIVIDNPDGNTLRVSTDVNYEVVLWDKGSGAALGNGTDTATLSETMSNFEFVRFEAEWQVYATDSDRTYNFVCKVFRPKPVRFAIDSMCGYGSATNTMYSAVSRFNTNTSMTEVSFLSKVCWLATNASTGISLGPVITKIVGIHRIANN